MTELIITEKPSACNRVADALADDKPRKLNISGVPFYKLKHHKKNIIVACAVGHLYTIAEKKKSFKYPSFNVEWKPTAEVDKNSSFSKKYLNVIKKLSKEVSSFTVATDFDIEGETIGLNIIRYACNQKDASRMKFSTLTKPDLIESYSKKQKSLDWGQAYAGEARHILDWLYGINLSRALTLALRKSKIYKTLSSGRVQGPALKIIVEKELEIRKFVPKKYWQLELIGKVKKSNINAWHEKDKFWDEKECKDVLKKVKGHDGTIKDIEKRETKHPPPFPFDLTTLQIEAHRLFGFTPKRTLDIAQELYLNGLISYPRTSSQKLPAKIGFKKILNSLGKQNKDYLKLVEILSKKNYLKPNEGNKTDPAHPAIYPTGFDSFKFNPQNKKIYDLIVKRFFATFGDWAKRETISIVIDVNSEKFIAKGTHTTEKGWYVLYEPYVRLKEEEFPELNTGETVKVKDIIKHDKETEPPKRYSQASLIKELEKRNLGTKSTRAQIIDSLYQREYVQEKSIEATELGIHTIRVLKKHSPRIVEEELTRYFEEEMEKIRKEKIKPETVINKAKSELRAILDDFKIKETKIGNELKEAYKEAMTTEIGICVNCKKGKLVVKHSRKTKQRFIACDAYPKCKTIFSIPEHGKIKPTDKKCEKCGFPLIQIINKKKQVVCFNPKCKTKKIIDKEVKKEAEEIKNGKVEKECPKCKKGILVVRKSVYGQFLGCSEFPRCRYTERLRDGPLKEDFNNKK
ncbi:DNA topoisomerase I [Candidatus Woesearchaeota archaeon]|nr:DNA topoisomerase I [Candidatus Woesearchaeota archaeon]